MSHNVEKETKLLYAPVCVCVRALVCVGAEADLMFTTHLRNVRGGHSLKALLTDIVDVNIKVTFKFTDEVNLLTLAPSGLKQRPSVWKRACVCVCLWVMGETTGLCKEEGERMEKGGDSVRWREKEAEEQKRQTTVGKNKSYIVVFEPFGR